MRNSDCVQKKKNIVPFLAFEKRVVTDSPWFDGDQFH
jgi:hypothetical protein